MTAKAQTAKIAKPKETPAGRWVSYRPQIKVLDCTIRDGGLMNNHKFDDQVVKAVYSACVEAGIDYMELGYKASQKIIVPGEHGDWKYCREEDMRRIVGDNPTPLKLSIMADAERTDYHEDILPKNQSVIDMVRVATYISQIPTALEMVKDAYDKGYETTGILALLSSSRRPRPRTTSWTSTIRFGSERITPSRKPAHPFLQTRGPFLPYPSSGLHRHRRPARRRISSHLR